MKNISGKPSGKALDSYLQLVVRYSWRKCYETIS